MGLSFRILFITLGWISDNAFIPSVLFSALDSSAIHIHLAYTLLTYLHYSSLAVSELDVITTFLCYLHS